MTASKLKTAILISSVLLLGGCWAPWALLLQSETELNAGLGGSLNAANSVAQNFPDEWSVGSFVIDMEIIAVDGDLVTLRSPFIKRNVVAVTIDGVLTETFCDGCEAEQQTIEFSVQGGSNADIAGELHGALFTAVMEAQATFLGSPDLGYCSEDNTDPVFGSIWWASQQELDQLETIKNTHCDPDAADYVACETAKCNQTAQLNRVWAQRRTERLLNDYAVKQLNVSRFMIYSHILESIQSADDDPLIEWFRNVVTNDYGDVDAIATEIMSQPAIDEVECIADITQPGGANPNAPDCSFDFGLGPVSVSYNFDGSITVSGGAGLIVGVTYNPSTKKTSVYLTGGLTGGFGPYAISGELGMTVDLSTGDVSSVSDVNLSVGAISCSYD